MALVVIQNVEPTGEEMAGDSVDVLKSEVARKKAPAIETRVLTVNPNFPFDSWLSHPNSFTLKFYHYSAAVLRGQHYS